MDTEMPDNKECDKCNSKRLLMIYVQGRDTHNLDYGKYSHEGYMPEGLGLYGNFGDAIQFKLCMQCGKVQGNFPKDESDVIEAMKGDEEE